MQAVGRFSDPHGQFVYESDVSVQIEQLGSGSIFLYYKAEGGPAILPLVLRANVVIEFRGQTDDALPVHIKGLDLYLGVQSGEHCFSVSRAVVGDLTMPYDSVELTLTNLVGENSDPPAGCFLVCLGNVQYRVDLRPADSYEDALFYLQKTSCPTVTAKLTITPGVPIEILDSLTSDLCATLSVIQGRKVFWVKRTNFSAGRIVGAEFGKTKTKNFTHDFLCFNPDKQTGINLSLLCLQSVLIKVREFRETYDPEWRIVNSWLDARLQEDFLEARTLKYAVVLEALCRIVESKHDDIPAKRIPRAKWRSTGGEFLPRIRDHLVNTLGVKARLVDAVCEPSNWGNLNRASFRTVLAQCLHRLDIRMHDAAKRIRRVTDVRNRVVHSFKYLTPTDFEELKWPVVEPTGQHFLVACFVDELVLRLFGLGEHVPRLWINEFRSHSRLRSRSRVNRSNK